MENKKKKVKENLDAASTKANEEVTLKQPPPDAVMVQSQSSVEITKDAKGSVKFMVKIYSTDPFEAAKMAKDIYDDLENKFND